MARVAVRDRLRRVPAGWRGRTGRSIGAAVVVGTVALVWMCATVPADARSYRDVPKSHWARKYVSWVTDQRVDGKRLMHDHGRRFRPGRPITRAELCRVLVRTAGKQQMRFRHRDIPDVPRYHPYYRDIQIALKLRLLGLYRDGFRPEQVPRLWQFHRAAVKTVRLRFPDQDWRMLQTLDGRRWEPNPGWRVRAPKYLSYEIAARYLGLRYNHPAVDDRLELTPRDLVRRDEAAFTVYQILRLPTWRVWSLRTFNDVSLPRLSSRQRQIVRFAVRWVGYPHVYGGEFPRVDSPYGRQAHGGFDCSGFDWWVMKMKFGYRIPVVQRSAAQMAAGASRRIRRSRLKACDLIFFGPNGRRSPASSSYHAALYLGNGWFIHSSSAGVSLASIRWRGWDWNTDLMWGRRLLTRSQLRVGR